MPSRVLSDVFVRQVKFSGRQIDHYDQKLPGLVLRVSEKAKSFCVMYRLGGKFRRLTLGRYPVLSVAEARDRAQDALRLVSEGRDPAVERQRAKAGYNDHLFSTLVDRFISQHAKPNTVRWRETQSQLEREFSGWRNWPISSITRNDVAKVVAPIAQRSPLEQH